jgi:phosphohistidine phosphatase
MELFFLRHAIAVMRGTPGYADDSKRPLTPEGARKMRRVAEGMRALGIEFDVMLSSPFIRAKQTAEIVAEIFGDAKKVSFDDGLAVGGDHHELIDRINKEYGTTKAILLVGHEPSMSELISVLLAGDPGLSITLKKGGLCKLSVVESLRYGRCATLDWLLAPKHLTGLA